MQPLAGEVTRYKVAQNILQRHNRVNGKFNTLNVMCSQIVSIIFDALCLQLINTNAFIKYSIRIKNTV